MVSPRSSKGLKFRGYLELKEKKWREVTQKRERPQQRDSWQSPQEKEKGFSGLIDWVIVPL